MTIKQYKKSQRPFLYRSLSSYLRGLYKQPIRKIPIDPGFGCPHRDDITGEGGCAFCSRESFVPVHARIGLDPVRQLEKALKDRRHDGPYILYLQAGTGTNVHPDKLKVLLADLCDRPGVKGLFIGTRPDCVDEQIIEVIKPYLYRMLVWLELGLQSSNDETLERINRGHDADSFLRAGKLAAMAGIPVLAHVILGLPGETPEDMISTARFLARHRVEGVKIHHMQIIRGTALEKMYNRGEVEPLTVDQYAHLLTGFLEQLPPWTVIHRLISDAPDDLLIAPRWPDRSKVIETIRGYMLEKGAWQGRLFAEEVKGEL
jgi:radical SAM protein (TIGR01212 family)